MSSLKKTLSYSQINDFLLQNTKEASDLFFKKDFTARELAEHFNIVYNQNFQKASIRVLGVKGKGLGGARVGSGNRVEKREIKQRKKDYEVVTIKLSNTAMGALKSSKDSHTNYIERAILYYDKVFRIIREDEV
jgi:hypothetical protein